MIQQDLVGGQGLALLDPHGDLAEAALASIPTSRSNDLVYLNPADAEYPVGFNPLSQVPDELKPVVADGVVSAFRHVWPESWGPRLDFILTNAAGTIAFVPTITRHSLALIGISNPASLSFITEVRGTVPGTTMRGCRDVTLSSDENTAYVTMDLSNGIAVVDITTPASASYLSTVTDPLSTSVRGITKNAAGTRLYVLGSGGASTSPTFRGCMTIWDVSAQNSPMLLSRWMGSGPSTGMQYIAGGRGIVLSPDENYLYITTEAGDSIILLDITDELNPAFVGGTKGPIPADSLDAAMGLEVKGGYAYICCFTGAASPSGRGLATVKVNPPYPTAA